jgi:hypothetical protein
MKTAMDSTARAAFGEDAEGEAGWRGVGLSGVVTRASGAVSLESGLTIGQLVRKVD